MNTQRLLCTRCGDSIHPDTAAANNGLCLPCVRGNMRSIQERQEEQRQRREADRADEQSPERLYWLALVRRVYGEGRGLEALPHGDRLYWLISVLSGEVHNGGFDQFFSNSSGDLYQETVDALTEVGDETTQGLLREARAVLFGEADVPKDRVKRFHLMATAESDSPQADAASSALDVLDKRFYAHADGFGVILEGLVREYRLYALS
jgi:Domain of unknown function (DUF4375)